MAVNWEHERYVRIYTRDTGDWLNLSFDAQAVWLMMLRKLDRDGFIHLGKMGRAALPLLLGHPELAERIDLGLEELLLDGCVTEVTEVTGFVTALRAPNFSEAQEWVATNAERQRKHRERKRSETLTEATQPRNASNESNAGNASVTPSLPPKPPKPTGVTPPVTSTPGRIKSAAEEAGGVSLREDLEFTFLESRGQPYAWTAKDEAAMGPLLGLSKNNWAEIRRRWRIGLAASFPKCRGVADLVPNWNAYATEEQPKRGVEPERAKPSPVLSLEEVRGLYK